MNNKFSPLLALLIIFSLLFQISCENDEDDPVIPPDLTIASAESVSATEIRIRYTIDPNGAQAGREFGLVWSTMSNPTIADDKLQNLSFTPDQETDILVTALNANTEYFFRLYVQDENAVVTYSNQVSALTSSPQALDFSPGKGTTGTEITLTGVNLVGGRVRFDGVDAGELTSSLKVVVPPGINNYNVSITVEVAGTVTTFAEPFTYLKGSWTQVQALPGDQQRFSPGLSINGFGFAGFELYKKDFWRYDPIADQWQQRADFPGSSGIRSAAFVLEGKAYTISGVNKEVWCYDPEANTWEAKTSFPGAARDWAAAFAINGIGYYGLGNLDNVRDFWKYDPQADQWTQLGDFPGPERYVPSAITYNGKGYVFGGVSGVDATWHNDFWEYDPANDSWTQKADLPASARGSAAAFVLNDKIYVGTGESADETLLDFWEFHPLDNHWTEVAPIPVGKVAPFVFGLPEGVFVGGGIEEGYVNSVWRFQIP